MTRKPALLAIDDDKIYHFLISKVLELGHFRQTGAEFLRFEDGRKAFEHISEHIDTMDPCVVLLDLNMPGYSGFDFLESLQVNGFSPKQISVYVVTSSVSEDDRERAESSGFVKGYLVKPARPPEVRAILGKEFKTA